MGRRDFTTSKPSNLIDMVSQRTVTYDSREMLGERIRYYRKRAGFLQPALATELGITKNSISNWEAGRSRPDPDNIVHMCHVLDITPSQLLGFEGDLSDRERSNLKKYRSLIGANKAIVDTLLTQLLESQTKTQQKQPNLIALRKEFKPLAAGIGDPSEFYDEGETIYVHADAIDRHVDYVFNVNGKSMEPDFHNGDMVMVQAVSTEEIASGTIGAFQCDNELYIKEYRKDGLYSHNTEYSPILFSDLTEVYLIGKVIGTLDKKALATPEEIDLYESLAGGDKT